MELLGSISGGDQWSSFNGIYSSEEADHHHFMTADHHLLAHCGVPNDDHHLSTSGVSSSLELPFIINWPNNNTSTCLEGVNVSNCSDALGITNSDPYNFSQGINISTYYSGSTSSATTLVTSFNSSDHEVFREDRNSNLFLNNIEGSDVHDHNHEWLMNQAELSNGANGEESGGNQPTAVDHVSQLKWEFDINHIKVPESSAMEENNRSLSGNSKKRSRSSADYDNDHQDPKKKRNILKLKRSSDQKLGLMSSTDNEGDGSTSGEHQQYSNSSDDKEEVELRGLMASSLSPPKAPASLNLSGKARATRGSATDPQSVYARKRREKINERLRVLQNLVPNGTKVDISTMLEEAVQYVKFLQLQIKLLSSDDLWMYAPLAHNGMDMGLDHLRLAALRQLQQ